MSQRDSNCPKAQYLPALNHPIALSTLATTEPNSLALGCTLPDPDLGTDLSSTLSGFKSPWTISLEWINMWMLEYSIYVCASTTPDPGLTAVQLNRTTSRRK